MGINGCALCLIPGSTAIGGDREEDGDVDDGATDTNYPLENQNQKQKIAERMLSWQMTYGRGEDTNYDKEVSHNHIPLLTNGMDVSFWHDVILVSVNTEIKLTFYNLPFDYRFQESFLLLHLSASLWHHLELVEGNVFTPSHTQEISINHVSSSFSFNTPYYEFANLFLILIYFVYNFFCS